MPKKQNYRSFQSNKGGHFISLYDDMIESAAWEELTANDIKLYLALIKKFRIKYVNGYVDKTNEENISMAKEEYTKLMTQRSFEKSIDHLIEMGFIKVVQSRYFERKCTIYGFNDMWKHYGTNKFKIKEEWKRVINRTL